MWTVRSPTVGLGEVDRIKPRDVLYSYDGPCIFTARLGFVDCLFYKVDEADGTDLFLAALTTSEILNGLKLGALSMRGAFQFQERLWLLQVDRRLNVKRTWETDWENVPEEFRPDPGVGVIPTSIAPADSVEQASSYFSVRFSGPGLTQWTIPLGTLKGLVDNVYDAFRKIFPPPAVDQRAFTRSLDFKVYQPRLASLIIAMKEPVVDLGAIKKDLRDKVDLVAVNQTFDASRTDFFNNMSHIVHEANKGDIKQGFAVEHFHTLSQINDLMPSEDGEISAVEFRANAIQAQASFVHIDDKIGDRIKNAFRVAERTKRRMAGTIVEVNAPSGTFVIADSHHRQTTCILQPNVFAQLNPSVGMKVRLVGLFSKRPRRDIIYVDGMPLTG